MTVASTRDRRDLVAVLASTAFLLLILVVDLATPLGYAEWALYLLPVGLALFQRNPRLPFVLAGTATLMTALGYFASPPGTTGW